VPDPKDGESRKEFLERCIPQVIEDGTAKDGRQATAICNSMWREAKNTMGDRLVYTIGDDYRLTVEERNGKNLPAIGELDPDDVLVTYGHAVKALGAGRIGGYLVHFGSEKSVDLDDDFFTADTDFGPHETSMTFYDHGLDGVLKRRVLDPRAALKKDGIGVWVEAQLAMRDEYEKAIYGLAEADKLGWSSGTAVHLVETEKRGKATWIKTWPLGLDASLTPVPAEPRTKAVALKTYRTLGLASLLEGVGETPSEMDPSAWTGEHWTEAIKIFAEVLQMTKGR